MASGDIIRLGGVDWSKYSQFIDFGSVSISENQTITVVTINGSGFLSKLDDFIVGAGSYWELYIDGSLYHKGRSGSFITVMEAANIYYTTGSYYGYVSGLSSSATFKGYQSNEFIPVDAGNVDISDTTGLLLYRPIFFNQSLELKSVQASTQSGSTNWCVEGGLK